VKAQTFYLNNLQFEGGKRSRKPIEIMKFTKTFLRQYFIPV